MIEELFSLFGTPAFWGSLSALLLASAALRGRPGSATISVAGMAAAFGPRAAAPYLSGIILGTTAVLVLVATGLTGAVLAIPGAAPVLIAAAALYILYLAYRIATAPPPAMRNAAGAVSNFSGGFLLAIANPKAYAAISAVFASVRLVDGNTLWDAGLKVAVLAVMVALINTAWLFVGSLFSRLLGDPVRARIVNGLFAAMLVAATLMAAIL